MDDYQVVDHRTQAAYTSYSFSDPTRSFKAKRCRNHANYKSTHLLGLGTDVGRSSCCCTASHTPGKQDQLRALEGTAQLQVGFPES